ncbi:MAG TPA: CYTH domain-containing protein, partial [Gemmatimonadales bacterium]|nr:CYTH domain-containing protein [Gemmatimonadales bacterium]
HARRYFNWNPWFYEGTSLEKICYPVPIPAEPRGEGGFIVETEAKYRVTDKASLVQLLAIHGFTPGETTLQRDEYYDTAERAMDKLDWVVRLRKESEVTVKPWTARTIIVAAPGWRWRGGRWGPGRWMASARAGVG